MPHLRDIGIAVREPANQLPVVLERERLDALAKLQADMQLRQEDLDRAQLELLQHREALENYREQIASELHAGFEHRLGTEVASLTKRFDEAMADWTTRATSRMGAIVAAAFQSLALQVPEDAALLCAVRQALHEHVEADPPTIEVEPARVPHVDLHFSESVRICGNPHLTGSVAILKLRGTELRVSYDTLIATVGQLAAQAASIEDKPHAD